MNVEWYYAKDAERVGPVSYHELRGLIENGHVAQDDLVWTRGMEDWRPARDVAELQQPYDAAHAEMPPVVYGAQAPRYHPLAIASLGTGIFGLLCCGLLSIAAIATGHVALAQIRMRPDQYMGHGLAVSGLVLGYIALFIFIIKIVFSIFGSASSGTFGL